MTKYLKRNREEIKNKIFSKLNLSANDELDTALERDLANRQDSQSHLDKALKETQKKKLGIRKLIGSNSTHIDFSDQMAQLKWRIDALKSFRGSEKKTILNTKTTSLTGKQQQAQNKDRQLTFDQLYQIQKKKFAVLKERRRSKMGDPKYIQMVGNMQLRKEKRKMFSKEKVDEQFRILNQKIEQRTE